ncbi:PH domain-containing protein [Calidifontibacter sp. DB0510]|uniref:PH domain-containing protein n=1 Tax=Metallococcus carri TaxID=1656884 RepID=A0A967B1B1_9MICO|nr:PH domain-containing protein [Metallococcus carri]NHN55648.1 PH domain-containing protein [Metallococcus carri]NOP38168.1 PH domain-containing protein [Calidifontibacter sp. DB2511S]
MWRVSYAIQGLVLVGIACAAWVFDWLDDPWRWLAVVVALLDLVLGVFVIPVWRYRVHRWELTDRAVYTQTGWFNQERRVAPLNRVQTVDTDRGPIAQLFGLTTVQVTTASAKGALRIEGLDRATAERLVDELTTQAALDEGDAT